MLWLYLAALVVGGGTLLLQVILGHAGGVDLDGDGVPDHDVDGSGPLVFSTRFWTFAALSFGLSGALLTLFRLASETAVLAIAGAAGLASGLFAAWVLRALRRGQVSSVSSPREAIGRIGELLVPCEKGRLGKVRLVLRGQIVDLLAIAGDRTLASGTRVIVEDLEGGIARVSEAPAELLP